MFCGRFLQHAKLLQIAVFLVCRFSQHFSTFTRVAARLLHPFTDSGARTRRSFWPVCNLSRTGLCPSYSSSQDK